MAASAPGKLILFGEHAVVFGEPALSTAIDLRAEVYARPHGEWLAGGKSLDDPRYVYVKTAGGRAGAASPMWLGGRSPPPQGSRPGPSASGSRASARRPVRWSQGFASSSTRGPRRGVGSRRSERLPSRDFVHSRRETGPARVRSWTGITSC